MGKETPPGPGGRRPSDRSLRSRVALERSFG